MKKALTACPFLLGLVTLATLVPFQASAGQAWSDKIRCSAGSGEAAQSLVIQVTTDGGTRARATQSWLGGTHDSIWVTILEQTRTALGGTLYQNKEKAFSVEIQTLAWDGKTVTQVLGGTFKDLNSGASGSLRPMNCQAGSQTK